MQVEGQERLRLDGVGVVGAQLRRVAHAQGARVGVVVGRVLGPVSGIVEVHGVAGSGVEEVVLGVWVVVGFGVDDCAGGREIWEYA